MHTKRPILLAALALVMAADASAQSANQPAVSQSAASLPGAGQQASGPVGQGTQVPKLPPLEGVVQRTAPAQMAQDMVPPGVPTALREFIEKLYEVDRAKAERPREAPKPVISQVTVTQAPTETAPTLRLARSVPSVIVFTDATGAQWPITEVIVGVKGETEAIYKEGEPTLTIKPLVVGAFGALTVRLQGNPVPVTIMYASEQKVVDTRLDVRMAAKGPKASAAVIDSVAATQPDASLMDFLYGTPPRDARSLQSSNPALSAWSYGGKLYVRTALPILSPAWTDSAASADRTMAYVLPPVPSVAVSIDGAVRVVQINE